MKNIFIILAIFTVAFSSCKTHEDALKATPVVIEEPKMYPLIASFKGNILGNDVLYTEKVDKWESRYTNTLRIIYEGINIVPLYLTPIFSLEKNNLGIDSKRIEVKFPSLASMQERNDIDFIRTKVLIKGKKQFLYSNADKDPSEWGKIDQFMFNYGQSGEKDVRVSTLWGSQEGSNLELVSVTETVPALTIYPDPSILKTFLITFNIDCKMYEKGGKYVGNIKGMLTYRWDYRLFKF